MKDLKTIINILYKINYLLDSLNKPMDFKVISVFIIIITIYFFFTNFNLINYTKNLSKSRFLWQKDYN